MDGSCTIARQTSLRGWPDLWLFRLGIALAFLFSALLIWVAPPNNNDSLATHMARIAYWMQRGVLFPLGDRPGLADYVPGEHAAANVLDGAVLGPIGLSKVSSGSARAGGGGRFWPGAPLGAARAQAFFAALLLATFPEILLNRPPRRMTW